MKTSTGFYGIGLALALALGAILIGIAVGVTAAVSLLGMRESRQEMRHA